MYDPVAQVVFVPKDSPKGSSRELARCNVAMAASRQIQEMIVQSDEDSRSGDELSQPCDNELAMLRQEIQIMKDQYNSLMQMLKRCRVLTPRF